MTKKIRAVQDQLRGLSGEQIDMWKKNYVADLGDVEFASFSVKEKPNQIIFTMRDAVMTHRHIAGNANEGQEHPFVQRTLESLYNRLTGEVPRKEEVDFRLQGLETQEAGLNSLIQFGYIGKIQETLTKILPEKGMASPSAKIKNSINFFVTIFTR